MTLIFVGWPFPRQPAARPERQATCLGANHNFPGNGLLSPRVLAMAQRPPGICPFCEDVPIVFVMIDDLLCLDYPK